MKQRGFTLIELMIAVAIFAVVSAIAIPLYTQYSERGYRTELTADLMNCAQALERGRGKPPIRQPPQLRGKPPIAPLCTRQVTGLIRHRT